MRNQQPKGIWLAIFYIALALAAYQLGHEHLAHVLPAHHVQR